MQVSAELRWFWEKDCPKEVAGWFAGPEWTCDPVRTERSDEYFVQPGNTEIGCKLRNAGDTSGNRAELKAMVTRFERNNIEIWGKWDWYLPSSAQSVTVHKNRQIRLCSAYQSATGNYGEVPLDKRGKPRNAFAMPEEACQIEFTEVRIDGVPGQWWTLGLEAWGDLPSAPLVLARILDLLDPPIGGGRLRNYPEFLDGLVSSPDARAEIPSKLIV